MRYLITRWLPLAVGITLLAMASTAVHGAESPLVGNWKTNVTMIPPGQEVSLFLIQVTEKDGKLEASLVATPVDNFKKGTTIENVKLDGQTFSMKLNAGGQLVFRFSAQVPQDAKELKKLLGFVEFRGQRLLVQFEKTADKEIDKTTSGHPIEGFADLTKAKATEDAKEKQKILKPLLEKNADTPLGYHARAEMIKAVAGAGGSEADVKAEAEEYVKLGEAFGPELKSQSVLQVARQLLAADAVPAVAADYAHQAEKLLDKDATDDQRLRVLKVLGSSLTRAGKPEAKDVEVRIAKIEGPRDEEFLKNAVPFKVEPFAGRRGKSTRVVAYELFTGTECPPCVAADVAFDALLETFKPTEAVFLEYHLHVPGPDPLTIKDNDARAEYYAVEGTPTIAINGAKGPGQGGPKGGGQKAYQQAVKAVEEALEKDDGAKLTLNARRTGNAIEIETDVADLTEVGENIRLRLVLVEEVVRYPGGNGQRFHHHVVRAFPGGLAGWALPKTTATQKVKLDLDHLAKETRAYLNKYDATQGPFPREDRPLDLKKLKVVALVQNDKTKEIYQAAQVDVEEAK